MDLTSSRPNLASAFFIISFTIPSKMCSTGTTKVQPFTREGLV